ncbi:MAG: hypothetical protein RL660_444 [Bacteroidota bacterium]
MARKKAINLGTAEQPRYAFVMSTEVVNSYGFRVLTDGIELSDFEANPVGYFNHGFNDSYKEEQRYPLGAWVNIRKEDGKLIGEFEPDMNDEEGKRLNQKIADGFINACSIYFEWIEWSEDADQMVAGQKYPTVTKCRLLECSPVGLPSNRQAIKLRAADGRSIALSSDTSADVLAALFNANNETQHSMKEILIALGLAADATKEQALQEISALRASTAENADTKALQTELAALKADRIKSLIDTAVEEGKIGEEQRENYTKLASQDFDTTQSALSTMAKRVDVIASINSSTASGLSATERVAGVKGAAPTSSRDCLFARLTATELETMQAKEPEKFKALQAEYLELVKAGK